MRFLTRVVLASLVALVGHTVDVDAHARLVAPAPWNLQPSQQQACGVTAANATPAKYAVSQVNVNAPLIVSWEVVIADGRGPLTATLDTTASNNPTAASFKVTLPVTAGTTNNPQAVSRTPYKISFQIPAGTVCTGPGETCTLRIRSSSNWVACSTIKLVGGAAPPAPATPPRPVDPNTVSPVPTPPLPPVYPPATNPSNGAGGVAGVTQRLVGARSGLTYMINAPAGTTARGMIAFLHGSTASNFANGVNMFAKVAAQYDLVRVSVLAPNGQGWNEGGAAAQVTAANSLLSLIQQDISTKYNIDQSKIFLTGQSSGAGFLSAYFVPLHADKITGGVFLQCGAAPPAAATGTFAPTAATIKNLPLHFEITTGDTIWPTSYANALRAYNTAGMKYTSLNTKPGGHCAFDQQQVVLDRIAPMLPKPLPPATPAPVTPTQPQPTTQTPVTPADPVDPVDPVTPTQKPATPTQKPADPDTTSGTNMGSGDTFILDGNVFTIAGADGGVAPLSASATPTASCVVATKLRTCSKVNGQSVQIITTADLMAVDANAQLAIDFGLNERSVISTIPSAACRQAYTDLICSQHFTPCGATTSTPQTCQATCRSANQACTFNTTAIIDSANAITTHASMYDCTKEVYGQIYADANGACAGAPPAIIEGGGDINGAAQLATPVAILLALASSLMVLTH